MQNEELIKSSIDTLSRKWNIEKPIYDLHLGRRSDVVDTTFKVNQVTFHIPKLSNDNLFVLWDCLWPDCHNCCDKQGRLPLTSKDISHISKQMGYQTQSSFLSNETYVATWENDSTSDSNSKVITTLTMLNLKRKQLENETDNG